MKIEQRIISHNPCYLHKNLIAIKGIVIKELDEDIDEYIKKIDKYSATSSINAIVYKDAVYELLPIENNKVCKSWFSGKGINGIGNNRYMCIGVIDYDKSKYTLTEYINHINISNNVISMKELYDLGYSNTADNNINIVLNNVEQKETKKENIGQYKIMIKVQSLYSKSGSSNVYSNVKQLKRFEIYNISKEENGYGYIEDIESWINLDKKYIRVID